MKALSILQPWADAILEGHKRIENRGWRTSFRGEFLIHAGKGFDDDGLAFIDSEMGILLPHNMRRIIYDCETSERRGAILGVATLVDCFSEIHAVSPEDRPWAFGPWCFELQNVRKFAVPIPYRGQRLFFDVPDDIVRGL